MAITICELDLTESILGHYKPKIISDIGPCKIEMALETKEIIAVVERDPFLRQEMADAGRKALEKASRAIAEALKAYDEDAQECLEETGRKTDALAFANGFEESYGDAADDAEAKARKGVQDVWRRYAKAHRDGAKHRIEIVSEVGHGAVGLGAGVSGAIRSPSTSAIPALARRCAGAAASASTALRTIAADMRSTAAAYSEIHGDLLDLQERYDGMRKMSATAAEAFAEGLDEFTTLGLDRIRRCESNLAAYERRLAGLKAHAHSASVELDKLRVGVGKVDDKVEVTGIGKLIEESAGELDRSGQGIDGVIGRIEELSDGIGQAKDSAGKTAADIEDLKRRIDKRIYAGASVARGIAARSADPWSGGRKPEDFDEAADIIGNVARDLGRVEEGFEAYFKDEE